MEIHVFCKLSKANFLILLSKALALNFVCERNTFVRKDFNDKLWQQKGIKWFNEFKASQKRVEDETSSERPSTSTNEVHVHQIQRFGA